MGVCAYYEYLDISGEKLFTMIALPSESGSFPAVVCRSPYVGDAAEKSEQELTQSLLRSYAAFLECGYAVVYQHCKGCGKSTGGFVPYIHEREDTRALLSWVRSQAFYCGEIYLMGGSYTASLHYTAAPFADDIKGAVFDVQDSERYNLWYRNGQMRKGHANWHFGLYQSRERKPKSFSMRSFASLPLAGLSERALGERAEDFEQMLFARRPSDAFWKTRNGGAEARDAVTNADIPILLTTGYNDYYIGGVFRMWERMDSRTKEKSALLVSPYNHGDGYDKERGIEFSMGRRSERFGRYGLSWLEHIRKGTPIAHEKGVVSYYRAFENVWDSDFYKKPTRLLEMSLGTGARSFEYDPKSPTAFSPEGYFAKESNGENSFVSVLTEPQDRDIFVKGRMRARLAVSSSCDDTSFYLRICIVKPEGAYVLRHDITSLSYQLGEYRENEIAELDFCFDEYAFLLKKGECLRIDIASTDDNTYVSHTNFAGEYCLQKESRVARNTVYLDRSCLFLPIED